MTTANVRQLQVRHMQYGHGSAGETMLLSLQGVTNHQIVKGKN